VAFLLGMSVASRTARRRPGGASGDVLSAEGRSGLALEYDQDTAPPDASVGAVRRSLVLASLAILVAVVAVGLVQAGGEEEDATAGRAGPLTRAQVLEPLRGAPPDLAALHRRMGELVPGGERALRAELERLRGRPVVVNLWASWCTPCRDELPYFQSQAARRGTRIAFLGVNVQDSEGGARRMLERFPVPYPSVVDPDRDVARALRAQGLPSTAFYGRDGRLVVLRQGRYRSEGALAADIHTNAP
jgi:thiol-disulfide isomerase/thioredoxin